jgi:hypothetical protein
MTWNANGDRTIFVNGQASQTILGVGDKVFGQNRPLNWTIGGDGLFTRPDRGNPDEKRYLRGELADFAIYDATLSADDIAQIMQSGVADAAGQVLWAGDADMNLRFDQLDLLRVQQSGKYLTGQTATWGDGDWNGAPGGTVGNPPAGDGVFNQFDIVAAASPAHYATGPYAALQPGGQPNDSRTSVRYDAASGELSVDPPVGVNLTSINIDSAAAIFTGDPAQNLGGNFDNDADGNIFKATFGGSFGAISFGNVAQAGLSEQFVLGDLTVVGSLAGGGALGDVDLIYVPVPEPSSLALAALSLLGIVLCSRRCR